MKYDLIVIGGGASGMCAAIAAARRGASVCILEQGKLPGRKLLATGNGKCNYTNELMDASYFRSDDPAGIGAVLEQYPAPAIVAFFEELGIRPMSRNGYLYPASGQASSVRKALEMECRYLKVAIRTEFRAEKAEKLPNGDFQVWSGDACCCGRKLVLSCGSCAAPKTGSDGSGYSLAAQLGHSFIPPVPALVQLECAGKFFRNWSGVRVQGKVTLFTGGKAAGSDQGELQLTEYGISGIPVFQVSRYASKALASHIPVAVGLNFFPEQNPRKFSEEMSRFLEKQSYKGISDALGGALPEKLTAVLLGRAGIKPDWIWPSIPVSRQRMLLGLMQRFNLEVSGTKGFDSAQVCAGGVRLREICANTMESLLVPGLYLTGELLDADGLCGGYNLHWAWATGLIAGKHAGENL